MTNIYIYITEAIYMPYWHTTYNRRWTAVIISHANQFSGQWCQPAGWHQPHDHPTYSAVIPLHTMNIRGYFFLFSMLPILEILIFQCLRDLMPHTGTVLKWQCAQKEQSFITAFSLSQKMEITVK